MNQEEREALCMEMIAANPIEAMRTIEQLFGKVETLGAENVELKAENERLKSTISAMELLRSEDWSGFKESCEYCEEESGNPLNWKYGLDHILEGYRYCPKCGRDLREREEKGDGI